MLSVVLRLLDGTGSLSGCLPSPAFVDARTPPASLLLMTSRSILTGVLRRACWLLPGVNDGGADATGRELTHACLSGLRICMKRGR